MSAQGPTAGPPRVRVGETLVLRGFHLDEANPVVLVRPVRDAQPIQVLPQPGGSDRELRVVLRPDFAPVPPERLSVWAAGCYFVSVGFRSTPPDAAFVAAGFRYPPDGTEPDLEIEQTTSELPMPLAPAIAVPDDGTPTFGLAAIADGVRVSCDAARPVQPDQRASPLARGREIVADPHSAPTDQLSFSVRPNRPGRSFRAAARRRRRQPAGDPQTGRRPGL